MGDEKEADDVAQPSSRITVFGDLLGLGSGTKALLDNISKAIGILYKPRAIKNDGLTNIGTSQTAFIQTGCKSIWTT